MHDSLLVNMPEDGGDLQDCLQGEFNGASLGELVLHNAAECVLFW